MGPGVPIQPIQQLGGSSVTAWCWILADSGRFLVKIARGGGGGVRAKSTCEIIPACYVVVKCIPIICVYIPT